MLRDVECVNPPVLDEEGEPKRLFHLTFANPRHRKCPGHPYGSEILDVEPRYFNLVRSEPNSFIIVPATFMSERYCRSNPRFRDQDSRDCIYSPVGRKWNIYAGLQEFKEPLFYLEFSYGDDKFRRFYLREFRR